MTRFIKTLSVLILSLSLSNPLFGQESSDQESVTTAFNTVLCKSAVGSKDILISIVLNGSGSEQTALVTISPDSEFAYRFDSYNTIPKKSVLATLDNKFLTRWELLNDEQTTLVEFNVGMDNADFLLPETGYLTTRINNPFTLIPYSDTAQLFCVGVNYPYNAFFENSELASLLI